MMEQGIFRTSYSLGSIPFLGERVPLKVHRQEHITKSSIIIRFSCCAPSIWLYLIPKLCSLFAVNLFILMLYATGFGGRYFWYVTLLFGPILFLTVLVHELVSRLLVCRRPAQLEPTLSLLPLAAGTLLGDQAVGT